MNTYFLTEPTPDLAKWYGKKYKRKYHELFSARLTHNQFIRKFESFSHSCGLTAWSRSHGLSPTVLVVCDLHQYHQGFPFLTTTVLKTIRGWGWNWDGNWFSYPCGDRPQKHLPKSLYIQSPPGKYTQLYSHQRTQVPHAVFCTIQQNPMNSLVWIPTIHLNAQNWFFPSFYVIGSWKLFLATLFYPHFKWITQQAPDPSFQPCCLFIYFFLSPSFSLLHFRWKVVKEWLWQPCLISLSGNFGSPPPPLLRTWCLYILLRVRWEWKEPGLASDLRGRRVLKDERERVEDGEKEMASKGEWLPCREQAISAGRLKLAFRRLLSKRVEEKRDSSLLELRQ